MTCCIPSTFIDARRKDARNLTSRREGLASACVSRTRAEALVAGVGCCPCIVICQLFETLISAGPAILNRPKKRRRTMRLLEGHREARGADHLRGVMFVVYFCGGKESVVLVSLDLTRPRAHREQSGMARRVGTSGEKPCMHLLAGGYAPGTHTGRTTNGGIKYPTSPGMLARYSSLRP